MRAPFDGVLVSGDLSHSVGAPVERGEVLFELAPLDDYLVVLEVPEAEVEKTAAVVKEVMEKACDPVLALSVPLVADIGTGPNWAEAH